MAVEVIQRLAVEIGANIKAFNQKMASVIKTSKTVGKRFGGLGRSISGIGKTVGAAAGRFRKAIFSMKGAILGLVTGLVLKKIKDFVNTVVDMGDQFAKTAKKIGIGVETLSGLKFAADLAGTSFQAVTGGFRRLASAAFDANEGLAESQRAFEALGIEVTDSEGNLRSLEDLFFDSADALQALTGDTERAALAQDLFGRAGLDLIPLLKQGSAEIRKQIKLAKELGITFSKEDAAAAEEFKDQMTILKAALFGFASTIVKEVIPAFVEFFKVLTVQFRSTTGEGEDFSTSVSKFIKGLLFTTIGAVELMKSIWNGLKIVWEGIKAAFVGVQVLFLAVFIQTLASLRSFISSFAESFDKLFNAVLTGFKVLAPGIIDVFVKLADNLLSIIGQTLSEIAVALSKVPKFAGLASGIGKIGLASAKASEKVEGMGEAAKFAISTIKGFDPAKIGIENIDKAIISLGTTNGVLNKQLLEIKANLDDLAETEAIPFWERAKEKIIALNEAILANEERLRAQAAVTDETAKQNQTKIGETALAFVDLFKQMANTTQAFTSLVSNAISQMASGIGNAVAKAIVFGENLGKSFAQIFKELAASIIAQLIQIIITALIANALLAALGIGGGATIASTGGKAKESAGGFFSGISSFFGGGMAEGGIVTRPTLALIGEAGPEAVIPLGGGGGGMGGMQTIQIFLDGDMIAETVVEKMPEVLRVNAGLSI